MKKFISIIYIAIAFFIVLPLSSMPLIMGAEVFSSRGTVLGKIIFLGFAIIPFSVLVSIFYVFKNLFKGQFGDKQKVGTTPESWPSFVKVGIIVCSVFVGLFVLGWVNYFFREIFYP